MNFGRLSAASSSVRPAASTKPVSTGPGHRAVTVTPVPRSSAPSAREYDRHEGLRRAVAGLSGQGLEGRGRGGVQHGATASGRPCPGRRACTGRRPLRRRCAPWPARAPGRPDAPGPWWRSRRCSPGCRWSRPSASMLPGAAPRESASVRSAAMTSARTPCARASSSANAVSLSSRRATSVTPWPSDASCRAISAPMPEEAPVTRRSCLGRERAESCAAAYETACRAGGRGAHRRR